VPFGRRPVHLGGVLMLLGHPVFSQHGHLFVRSGGAPVSFTGLGVALCGSQMSGVRVPQ
jgi:hypothetical protein